MIEKKGYDKEQLFLLGFLYYLDEFNIGRPFYNTVQILSFIDKGESSKIEKWVSSFVRDKLIKSSGEIFDYTNVDITVEGKIYVRQNSDQFEEFISIYNQLSTGEISYQKGDLVHVFQGFEKNLDDKQKLGNKTQKEEPREVHSKEDQNGPKSKHALSTKLEDAELISNGYSNQGLIGYSGKEFFAALPILKQVLINPGTTEDYFYFFDRKEENVPPNSLDLNPIGRVLREKDDEYVTLKLYRYLRKEPFDHFYCTNPNNQAITEAGYIEEPWEAHLFKTNNEVKQPVYVYSTNPNVEERYFEPLTYSNEANGELKRSAPFWADSATEVDEFGRESLVKAIIRSTNKLFGKETFKDSYTIHLNGEWGSGKSSMLKFFKKELENSDWKIVQYNAWENQSFSDPWWILINAVSKRTSKGDFKGSFNSHRYWKFKLQYRHKLMALALIVILGVSAYIFSISEGASNNSIGFYGSLIALVGTIISVITGLTNNFFYKEVSKEDLKDQFSDHPFKPIRERFDAIAEENRLAIFIDDLDRCDVKATVLLLEGIQNLFKGKKVLYIIAADGAWVSQCFSKRYNDFEELEHLGVKIGDKFLQKTFQLRVDVPEIGENYLQDYWNRLINHRENSSKVKTEGSSENDDASNDAKEIKEQKQELDIKLANAEQDVEENIESFLKNFLSLGVPKNPRQMKRFVNQYVVARQTKIIESGGVDDFGSDEDVKMLNFSMKYPSFYDAYSKGEFNLEKYSKPESETKLTEAEKKEIEYLLNIKQ